MYETPYRYVVRMKYSLHFNFDIGEDFILETNAH